MLSKNILLLTNTCNNIEKLIKWDDMDIYLEDKLNEMFDECRYLLFINRDKESVNIIIDIITLLKRFNLIENKSLIYIYKEIINYL